jgi:hypothetical protein
MQRIRKLRYIHELQTNQQPATTPASFEEEILRKKKIQKLATTL